MEGFFYLSVSPARRAPHPNQATIGFTTLSVPLTGDRNPSRKGKDVTALRCSEPLRSKVGGPKRSAPFYAGWDRLGKGGDLFNFTALAMVVRDGTAGGKGETEEYNYSLSIRLRSVFIFFP